MALDITGFQTVVEADPEAVPPDPDEAMAAGFILANRDDTPELADPLTLGVYYQSVGEAYEVHHGGFTPYWEWRRVWLGTVFGLTPLAHDDSLDSAHRDEPFYELRAPVDANVSPAVLGAVGCAALAADFAAGQDTVDALEDPDPLALTFYADLRAACELAAEAGCLWFY